MRYMSIVKATPSSEAGKPPSPQLLAAMGQLIGEMMAAGVLEACEGLFPSSYGTRVKHSDGKLTVTDGPFAETKELVGGYAILQVASVVEFDFRCVYGTAIHMDLPSGSTQAPTQSSCPTEASDAPGRVPSPGCSWSEGLTSDCVP